VVARHRGARDQQKTEEKDEGFQAVRRSPATKASARRSRHVRIRRNEWRRDTRTKHKSGPPKE
jgi:hypothetical protein